METTTGPVRQVSPAVMPAQLLSGGLKCEIILGSPSSGCQGVGICRVMAQGELLHCPCPRVTGWIAQTAVGRVRVSFLKSELTPAVVAQHFQGKRFEVKAAYTLPGRIRRAAGVAVKSIEPGIYAVTETGRFLTVEF